MIGDVPLYHIELVRDRSIPLSKMDRTGQCAEVFHELLDKSPVEQMAVIHLDASFKLVGVEKVGFGTLTMVQVSMANIFRGALLASAPFIVLGHNHPSDDPTPSRPDWDLTDAARNMGMQLGVEVLDHIVVAQNGEHVSMKAEDFKQQDALLGSIKSLMDIMPPDLKKELETKLLGRGIDPNLFPPTPLDLLDELSPIHKPRSPKIGTNLGSKLLPLFNRKK